MKIIKFSTYFVEKWALKVPKLMLKVVILPVFYSLKLTLSLFVYFHLSLWVKLTNCDQFHKAISLTIL